MRKQALALTATVTALGLLMAAAPTYADDIVNDVDATVDATVESVTVAAGSTRVVTLRVIPTDDPGKSGCNLTGRTTTTFAVGSSNTALATVTPATITFTSCGDAKEVTVTGVAAGTAVISLTQGANTTEGTFNVAPATFQTVVTSPCSAAAPSAPSLTVSTPASTGWFNAASGPASFSVNPTPNAEYSLDGGTYWTAYTAPVEFTSDGIRSVTARSVVPAVGSCASVNGAAASPALLQVDRTAPTHSIAVSPDANAVGWNNTAVGVTYTCSDAGSGLTATCPATENHLNGTNQNVTTTSITDVAGNSTSASRRAIKVDTVKPTVTATVQAAYNDQGFNQPFGLTYSCVETGSGLVGSCPTESFTEVGSPYAERSVSVTDVAGNFSDAFARRAVKIDATGPTATVIVAQGDNGAGWNNRPVTADWTCADSGSGLSSTCPDDETFSADGDYAERRFTALDHAGNASAEAVRRRVRLDTTAPSVAVTVLDSEDQPAISINGFYRQAVTIHFTCSDPTVNAVSAGLSTGYPCPADIPVIAEGTTGGAPYVVHDIAGNATTGTIPAISIDTIAPTLSVTVDPSAGNAAGWNKTDVTVGWTCSDGGSGINPLTPCPADSTYVNGQTAADTSATVRDLAGNSTGPVDVREINVDTAAPDVTVTLRDALGARIEPNVNEWFAQQVTVDFTCSDTGGSGLVTGGFACPTDYPLGDGVFGGFPGTVHDVADNFTGYTVPTIRIDTVKPVLSVTSAATAIPVGTATWFKDAVTATFAARDVAAVGTTASDLASTVVTPFMRTSTGEGSGVNIGSATARSIVDLAGNVADDIDAGPYMVDGSAPTVEASISSPLAYQNFYRDSVSIAVTAADPALADSTSGSGLSAAPTTPVTRTDTGSFSAIAVDNVGHSTTSNTVSFKVDSLAPVVQLNCAALPTTVNKGDMVTLPWTATDEMGGSGLAGTASGSVMLDTSTVGSARSAGVPAGAAADNVGHSSAASNACTYGVTYKWTGFFQPIDNKDAGGAYIYNAVKAGSTIPAKFNLAGDQGLGILAASSPASRQVICPSGAGVDAIEEVSTATVSGLKYDAIANQYIYNWKTASSYAGTCREFALKLTDGTTHLAYFKFTK